VTFSATVFGNISCMLVMDSTIDVLHVAHDGSPQGTAHQGLFLPRNRYLGKVEAEFSGSTNKLVSLAGSPTLLGQNGSDSNITPDPEAQVRQR
jgi:hypothetical protein